MTTAPRKLKLTENPSALDYSIWFINQQPGGVEK